MKYQALGQTGLYVSKICLGTMTFGGSGFWAAIGQLGQSDADAIVSKALEAGVNFIDTADCYSEGLSEQITGQAIRNSGKSRSDIVLATKAYVPTGPGPNNRGASRGHLLNSVQASLKRLDTDYIDLFQLHGYDPATPLEETLRTLDDMVSRGYVRYVGVSNWPAWAIAQAQGLVHTNGWNRLASLQAYYSLAGRGLDRDVVPYIKANPLGLMVWSPLAGGILSGKFHRDGTAPEGGRRASFDFPPIDRERTFDIIDVMRGIAASHEVSVARIGLAWVLSKPFVTSVIIGAKNTDQLNDNLAAIDIQLSQEELAILEGASALAPEYPGWMMEYQQKQYLQR
ncbi:aldo/keto reductase [Pseudomonas tolaasii]|uniref:aldo/keto reductase n=1 Tax=Pseudomonas tolaasii TaxID=29442 RepID=UPI001C5F207D|nr:aldo/keto reductase [Pseudomonas tolaasii]MBW4793232.1 aldo/keto reductase [Pseudomonas tolaasii]